VVAVLDQEGQRCTDGVALHYTSQDAGPILLDFHARPGSVTLLAASQVMVNYFLWQGQACRDSFKDCDQSWPMRFSSGQKT
jgi:hypothetical protein